MSDLKDGSDQNECKTKARVNLEKNGMLNLHYPHYSPILYRTSASPSETHMWTEKHAFLSEMGNSWSPGCRRDSPKNEKGRELRTPAHRGEHVEPEHYMRSEGNWEIMMCLKLNITHLSLLEEMKQKKRKRTIALQVH